MAFVPALPLPSRASHTARVAPRRAALPTAARRRAASTAGARGARMATESELQTETQEFSAAGMTVEDFFTRSAGEWRSQRSSHNLAWTQFEQITSAITITTLEASEARVRELCAANKVDESDVALALHMAWEGESDWDDEVSEGETVMAVVKDSPNSGSLLRSVGYAETIPAVGKWTMSPDGVFVLVTPYDAAAAEERIWFATPNLRMRVSQIRTSSGAGVVTASLSTEIRRIKLS